MTHDDARALIDTQFADGPLPPLQDQALRAHVRKCSPCKAYYDRTADLEAGFGGDAPVVERLLARGAPAPQVDAQPTRPRARIGARAIGGLAIAAGIILAVGLWSRGPQDPPEWTPKGAAGAVARTTRLFHQPAGGKTQRLAEQMRATDGLLVSYTNPQATTSEPTATHLAVVARDAGGRVLWIQPPWTDPAARPQTLPIQAGVADQELPGVIHHDFKAGPLEICSVFGHAPRDVAGWDTELTQTWPPKGATCRRVEVTE